MRVGAQFAYRVSVELRAPSAATQASPTARCHRSAPTPVDAGSRDRRRCSRASTSTTGSSAPTSARAKERFEAADWADGAAGRPGADPVLRRAGRRVRRAAAGRVRRRSRSTLEAWQEAKLAYIGLLVDHKQPELAETFFNSVIDAARSAGPTPTTTLMFVRAAISTEYIDSDPPIYRSYYPADGDLARRFARILLDFGWSRPFADLERDLEPAAARARRALRRRVAAPRAEPPGPGARARPSTATRPPTWSARSSTATSELPFVVPVLHDGDGGSRSTRSCSTRRRSTSSSRSRAPTSWSTWRCRRATSSSCAG